MTNRKLIRSTGMIGSAITTSRVLGFLRDIIFARWFGTNIYAQAFVVAYRIPNMLRDMVGEGATNAAIVPVLSHYEHTRSKKEFWKASRVILNLMLLVLAVLTVLGVTFAPFIVKLIAPGFVEDPEKYRVAVTLTRYTFPYIFFLGMVAYCKGVLNSLHYFVTPAFAPVVLNVSIILSLLFLCPVIGIKGVVVGILAGGVMQVLMQIPPLRARGFRFTRDDQIKHPVAGQIGRLLLPRALGTAVYQLSILVDTILASLAWIVGAGGVAALYYSSRLIQLPLAVFGISLATAVLPRLSKEVAGEDMPRFRNTVAFSLKTVFTVMIPAAFGLIVLARPIITVLFQRGEFTAYSTDITSSALFFYTFGLFAYAGIKILVNSYYSMGDTRTPVKTAAIALGINVGLNLILMWPLKIGGLALATSIAATANFAMLYYVLTRRIGDIGTADVLGTVLRVAGASGLMALYTYWFCRLTAGMAEVNILLAALVLLANIATSAMVYVLAAYLMRVEGVRKLVEMAGNVIHR